MVGARSVATELGKKGTQSDITLYNSVRDGHAATLVEPTQFPEKIAPLLLALAMADRTIVVVPSSRGRSPRRSRTVDLFEMPVELLLGPSVGEREVRKAFKGTRIEGVPSTPLDLPKLRAEVESWEGPADVPGRCSFESTTPSR